METTLNHSLIWTNDDLWFEFIQDVNWIWVFCSINKKSRMYNIILHLHLNTSYSQYEFIYMHWNKNRNNERFVEICSFHVLMRLWCIDWLIIQKMLCYWLTLSFSQLTLREIESTSWKLVQFLVKISYWFTQSLNCIKRKPIYLLSTQKSLF